MKLILVRHGQTEENVKGLLQGQGINSFLNNKGIEQAKKLARRLKKEKINVIYSSDLQRALKTAEEVMSFQSSAKLVSAQWLRERNLGIYEGRKSTEYYQDVEKSSLPFHIFKPSGGESLFELYSRVENSFKKIIKKHKDDTVLLVSHGGVSTMLLLKIFNKSITNENCKTYKVDNASISMLEIFEKKTPVVQIINDTGHLKN